MGGSMIKAGLVAGAALLGAAACNAGGDIPATGSNSGIETLAFLTRQHVELSRDFSAERDEAWRQLTYAVLIDTMVMARREQRIYLAVQEDLCGLIMLADQIPVPAEILDEPITTADVREILFRIYESDLEVWDEWEDGPCLLAREQYAAHLAERES